MTFTSLLKVISFSMLSNMELAFYLLYGLIEVVIE